MEIPLGRGRGDRDAAAATWMFRGDEVAATPRRRRPLEIRGRRRGPVAVMQRLRRGDDARLDLKTFRMKWKCGVTTAASTTGGQACPGNGYH